MIKRWTIYKIINGVRYRKLASFSSKKSALRHKAAYKGRHKISMRKEGKKYRLWIED